MNINFVYEIEKLIYFAVSRSSSVILEPLKLIKFWNLYTINDFNKSQCRMSLFLMIKSSREFKHSNFDNSINEFKLLYDKYSLFKINKFFDPIQVGKVYDMVKSDSF